MDRSQVFRNTWLRTVRRFVARVMALIGAAAGFFVADVILDLGFDTSLGVLLGAGAVFYGVGLYVRRLVPKPVAGAGAAGAVGTAAAATNAVADLLDD